MIHASNSIIIHTSINIIIQASNNIIIQASNNIIIQASNNIIMQALVNKYLPKTHRGSSVPPHKNKKVYLCLGLEHEHTAYSSYAACDSTFDNTFFNMLRVKRYLLISH